MERFDGAFVLSLDFWISDGIGDLSQDWVTSRSFFLSEARQVAVTTQPIRLYPNFMTLIPNLIFTELWEMSMEHL